MGTRLTIGTIFLVVLSLIMTGCLSGKSPSSGGSGSGGSGSGGNGGGGNGSPTLQGITVSPPGPTVAPGDTEQFKALAHYSDGSSKDVTNQSAWSSADTAFATVDPNSGLATAVASGSTSIIATFSGQTNSATLNVASLSNVKVNPSDPSIGPTETQQFTANANYSNGESKDVTTNANTTWASSDHSIATISGTGLATAIAAGTTTITASFGGDNGTTTLTVLSITSVTVTPIGPAIGTTGTQQFKATANFNNNTNKDVTNLATWTATNPTTVASINSTGLATAIGAGQSEISATYLKVTGMTALDVTTATFTNNDLSGDYVVSLTGVDSRGPWFLVGSLSFNASNGQVSGTVDSNTAQGVKTAQTVVGRYTVFPDGRADVSFGGSVSTGGSHAVRIILTGTDPSHVKPAAGAQVIEFDSVTVSTGKLEQQQNASQQPQTCASFGANDIQGAYAFGEGGFTPGAPTTRLAGVGSFTATGTTIAGQEDVNNNGVPPAQTNITGSYTQDTTTACRYVVTLNNGISTSQFAYYAVAPGSTTGKAYFLETDSTTSAPVLGGVAEQQATATISPTAYVFLTDLGGTPGEFHIAGQFTLSGNGTSGTITGGEEDEAPPSSANAITGGTYAAQGSGGRYLLSETTANSSNPNFVLYVVSGGRFFMLRTDSGADKDAMGAADAQTGALVVSGTYGLGGSTLSSTSTARADLGLLTTSGTNISGIGDRDAAGTPVNTVSSLTLSGTIPNPIDGSGRGTINLQEPGPVPMTYIFYIVSGNKLVVIGETPNTDGTMSSQ